MPVRREGIRRRGGGLSSSARGCQRHRTGRARRDHGWTQQTMVESVLTGAWRSAPAQRVRPGRAHGASASGHRRAGGGRQTHDRACRGSHDRARGLPRRPRPPAAAPATNTTPTVLKMARNAGAGIFVPWLIDDNTALFTLANVYDGLLRVTKDGAGVEPALATTWETVADGLTWTFTLRTGRQVLGRLAAHVERRQGVARSGARRHSAASGRTTTRRSRRSRRPIR